jgi:hypothetical protein
MSTMPRKVDEELKSRPVPQGQRAAGWSAVLAGHDRACLSGVVGSCGLLRVLGDAFDGQVRQDPVEPAREPPVGPAQEPHAGPGSATEVTIRIGDRAVTLDVVDDGHGANLLPGSGHGLVGMRERAQLLDGRFRAGPRPGGGFHVVAVLPVGDESA